MKKNQVARDNKFKAANAKKGLVQVTIWVPEDKADLAKKRAANWRKAHAAATKS